MNEIELLCYELGVCKKTFKLWILQLTSRVEGIQNPLMGRTQ